MTRAIIRSGTEWEPLVGYARSVRVGDHVYVSGTTATDADGRLVAPGDARGQTRQCLRNIGAALERAGATFADVVRTRIYVVDIDQWEAIGRAHREVFGGILPASAMVEVRRLIHPEMLVEIEVDAIVGSAAR